LPKRIFRFLHINRPFTMASPSLRHHRPSRISPSFTPIMLSSVFLLLAILLHLSQPSIASITPSIDELAHPHPIPPAAAGPVLRSAIVITRHGDR
jgi:hypothetical protein